MATEVRPPNGWEVVERFLPHRTDSGETYREVFVRKIIANDEERDKEDLYLWKEGYETEEVLRIKDSEIIFFMPLYLIVKCARDCLVTITSIAVDLKHGRIWCVLKDIVGFVWGKVRDPFFAIAVLACAIFGLYSPFEGRVVLARVEREWHHVEDLRDPEMRIHHHACRHGLTEKDAKANESVPVFFSRDYYFLIAYCFQPHGSSNDPRYPAQVVKC